MSGAKDKGRPIRVFAASIALTMAFWSVSASLERLSAASRGGNSADHLTSDISLRMRPKLSVTGKQDQKASGTMYSSKRMADGKQWMTRNLHVNTAPSYCYDDAELNCRQYGRLYTWESGRRVCQSLGAGWRLPTNDEWRQMAKQYGGVRGDSDDGGKAAYKALVVGGSSGFNAVFGGFRSENGQYARLQAHGLYWTASESGSGSAWLYNFGQARFLNRHNDGEKRWALSVRCVSE